MLAAICVAGLVAGTVAAMAFTQSLRKEGPIASEIRFKDPNRDGSPPFRVCFRLPRDDIVDVEIVASGSRELVAVLADGERLNGGPTSEVSDASGEGNAHCYRWDGTDTEGQAAGEGIYRLRVTLREADRSGVSGEKIRISVPVGEVSP